MILSEPAIIKARKIRSGGDSVSRSVLRHFQSGMRRFGTAVNKHRVVSLILALALVFSLFTVGQGTSVPRVISVLPSEIVSGFSVPGNYSDNFSFRAYSPAVSAEYYAVMNGPLPQQGGINSSTIYAWAYSIIIIKTAQNSSFPWPQQTLVIRNVTVSIGNYLLPFRENGWDTGLVYFNGGIVSNPSGTFDTGNEYGLQVEPVNEISCNIPNGNYTMTVHLKLEPVSVLGPYSLAGEIRTVGITFPVYINNSVVLDNPV